MGKTESDIELGEAAGSGDGNRPPYGVSWIEWRKAERIKKKIESGEIDPNAPPKEEKAPPPEYPAERSSVIDRFFSSIGLRPTRATKETAGVCAVCSCGVIICFAVFIVLVVLALIKIVWSHKGWFI